MKIKTFAEKLVEARKKRGMTQAKIANMLNVTPTCIYGWEKGKAEPTVEGIKKLCKILDIDADWLIGVNEGAMPTNIVGLPNKKNVPLVGKIACGQPIIADEERGEYVECDEDITADFALIASGDSMTGARILDGDVVYIHRQDTVNNGEIAAVMLIDAETGDAEATLKRVFWDGKKLILSAENSKYPPMVFTGDELEGAQILGKAVAFRSKVR